MSYTFACLRLKVKIKFFSSWKEAGPSSFGYLGDNQIIVPQHPQSTPLINKSESISMQKYANNSV